MYELKDQVWLKRVQIAIKALFSLLLLLGIAIKPTHLLAADLKSLESLYTQNFDAFYQPRFCGRNIARLVNAALDRKIDLEGAYVLKIEGAGFLETSGFYTRNAPNEREMLGYFHVVLVAENHVFDFDLHEPLSLDVNEYIRLQFSPANDSTTIYGMKYRASEELKWWTVTRFEISDFIQDTKRATWKIGMDKYVDINSVLSQPRVR